MGFSVRIAGCLGISALWALMVGLGLEAYARYRDRADQARVPWAAIDNDALRNAHAAVLQRYEPVWPMPPAPAFAEILDANESQRLELARALDAVIVACDPDRIVRKTYPGATAWNSAPLLTTLHEGVFIESLFRDEHAPFQSVWTAAAETGAVQALDERLIVDEPPRFHMLLQRNINDGQAFEMLFAIRPSIFSDPWKSFTPNLSFTTGIPLQGIARFSTNEHGYRGGSMAIPKPPASFRVVCIGGSTTVEGFTDATTYPAILQHVLHARFGADGVEVVNCGMFAETTGGQFRRIGEYLDLSPDLIIYYNFINDPRWKDAFWLDVGAKGVWGRVRRILARHSMFVRRAMNRLCLAPDGVVVQDLHMTTFASLRRIAEQCRERDVPLAVCSFAAPAPEALSDDDRTALNLDLRANWFHMLDLGSYYRLLALYHRELEAFCVREAIDYVPVAEQIHGGYDLFTDLCHMTPSGVERKAMIVADYIEDRWGDHIRALLSGAS